MMMVIAMVMMVKMQANAKVHMGEMSEPPAPALSEHKIRRMMPTIVWIYVLFDHHGDLADEKKP